MLLPRQVRGNLLRISGQSGVVPCFFLGLCFGLQESNTDAEAIHTAYTADSEHLHGSAEMQSALLARSSRSASQSSDASLDAAVSAKIFGSIIDTFEQLGTVLTDAGALSCV